jgi:hypothetical protein
LPTMETILPLMSKICSRQGIRQLKLRDLRSMPLQKIARSYGAATNAFQERYIQRWPAAQLEAVRGVLIHAREKGTPVTFRWAESESTFVEIGGTSRRITVLFRNPVPAKAASPKGTAKK